MKPTTFYSEAVDGIEFYPFPNSVCITSHFGKKRPIFMTVITSPITVSPETRENRIRVRVTGTPVVQQEDTPGPATRG